MGMTITGAEATTQIQDQQRQALQDASANAARNAFVSVYGAMGGDPDAWMKVQAAKKMQDEEPYAGPTAAADLQTKQLSNTDTQRQQQQMAVYRAAGMLKNSAKPDGSVDPDAFDKLVAPNAQLFGLAPQQLPQVKALLTAPGGTQHLDDIQQSMLGPAKVTGGEQFGTVNGQTVSLAHDQYGRPIVQNLGGIVPTSVQNANTRQNNAPIGPDGQVNQSYVNAKAQIAAAAAKAGVSLTPQAITMLAGKAAETGQLPTFGMGGGKNTVAVANEMAAHGHSGTQLAANAQTYKSKQAFLTDLAHSGPTSAGGIARSGGAVFAHIDLLDQLIDGLQNKNIPYVNAIQQKFKQETGQPAPTNFDAQKQLVASEIGRFIIARGGTLADRKEFEDNLSKAKSPQQLRGVIATYRDDIGQQLYAQYAQAKGLGADKEYLGVLTPAARFILTGRDEPSLAPTVAGRATGNRVPGAAPGGGLPRITGDADFAKLPPGAHFIAPDGSTRVKH